MEAMKERTISLDKGAFMLTFDVELAWGTYYARGSRSPFLDLDFSEVRSVVDEILDILDRYELSATWAFVGHLLLNACDRTDGVPHPDVVRPRYEWFPGDWFRFDPCSSAGESPGFYGPDLLRAVLDRDVQHEIAAHSFSHIIFDDPGCSSDAAASDLRKNVEVARSSGIEMRSFVFPQGKVRHEALLPVNGLQVFRGLDERWYYRHSGVPSLLRKVLHMADQFLGVSPPVVLPVRRGVDLWEMPGSLPLLPSIGFRRFLPVSVKVRKARKGVARAAARRRIYHLWTHPWNFLYQRGSMMRALSEICGHVAGRRDRGDLDVMTMGAVCQLFREEAD